MNSSEREALRRSFLPERVRVLFVGESPPAGGTFFYSGDSMLYRATRDAFCAAFGSQFARLFLDRFAEAGCYLEDLCLEPINHLTSETRRAARRQGEASLAQRTRVLQPDAIVVLLKSIADNVARAASAAGYSSIERHVLTYPSRWHRHREAYQGELTALLHAFELRGILNILPS
jgi:hypothetical protein